MKDTTTVEATASNPCLADLFSAWNFREHDGNLLVYRRNHVFPCASLQLPLVPTTNEEAIGLAFVQIALAAQAVPAENPELSARLRELELELCSQEVEYRTLKAETDELRRDVASWESTAESRLKEVQRLRDQQGRYLEANEKAITELEAAFDVAITERDELRADRDQWKRRAQARLDTLHKTKGEVNGLIARITELEQVSKADALTIAYYKDEAKDARAYADKNYIALEDSRKNFARFTTLSIIAGTVALMGHLILSRGADVASMIAGGALLIGGLWATWINGPICEVDPDARYTLTDQGAALPARFTPAHMDGLEQVEEVIG